MLAPQPWHFVHHPGSKPPDVRPQTESGIATNTALLLATSSTRVFERKVRTKHTPSLFALLYDHFFSINCSDLLGPLYISPPQGYICSYHCRGPAYSIKSKKGHERKVRKKGSSHFLPCFFTIVRTKNCMSHYYFEFLIEYIRTDCAWLLICQNT